MNDDASNAEGAFQPTKLTAEGAMAVAEFLNDWRAEQPDDAHYENGFDHAWNAFKARCPHPNPRDHGRLGTTCSICGQSTGSRSDDETEACLGTLADLGVFGKEVAKACAMIEQQRDRLASHCRVCRRKMAATLHDGSASAPAPPRRLAIEGDVTICDACFEREAADAATTPAGASPEPQ